ncbi:MAG: hypothetical protein Q8P89_03290 [bacterium]|nr:hypothetical protein [bacterium]
MKNAVSNLYRDPFCLGSLTLSLIALLFGLALLGFGWGGLPPQIPLFYSRPWGEAQLAPNPQIVMLPGLAFSIIFLNIIFSARLLLKEPVLARVLIGASFVLVLILILALFQIVNLVS